MSGGSAKKRVQLGGRRTVVVVRRTPDRMPPLKLAIIGGGPSSFYVASRLLSLFPKDEPLSSQLRIHIYDKLWAPHGLVRYGVAPDHPEVKVCYAPYLPYLFSKEWSNLTS
jgi:hypothetical protein